MEIEDILNRFKNKGLVKGYKTFRNSNIDFNVIENQLNRIINERVKTKRYGEILSLIYLSGRTYNQNIESLIRFLFKEKDYPTFLKQAYRFDIFEPLKEEIEFAIEWHIKNNKVDGFAWKVKFLSLAKSLNCLLEDSNVYEKIEEEESIEKNQIITLKIQPINRTHNLANSFSTNKYIQIEYEKKKLDNANISHSNTQIILENFLRGFGVSPIETKHIDVYAEFNNNQFIFEIKSITQRNERPQTRSAVSQLYEYSFLYGIIDPLYFILFSSKPDNEWIIQYLEKERNIRVLWIELDGKIGGSGYVFLEQSCVKYMLKQNIKMTQLKI